jgi:hypothetical protein
MNPQDLTYLNDPHWPRGIRNNNPGNLRRTKDNWLGKVSIMESKDRSFEQFKKYWHGIRALIKDLRNDYFKDKKQTISELIYEYAPPTENNTKQYINQVCKATGLKPDEIFEWNKETIKTLCIAIVKHENGRVTGFESEVFDYAWTALKY